MTDADVELNRAVDTVTETLLLGLRQQTEDAWRRLVLMYGALIFYWCRRRGISLEDTQDIAQEVFLAVRRGIETFRRDRPGDSFRGWLWTITLNKIRDHARRSDETAEGVSVDLTVAEEAVDPSSGADQADGETLILFRQVVGWIRSEFSERDWQAFWLTVVEEQSVAEVAKKLDMSPNMVYLARSKIRRRIQELQRLESE